MAFQGAFAGTLLASLGTQFSSGPMTDIDPRPLQSLIPASPPPATPGSSLARDGAKTWTDGETASFKDLLAIVNPLQHIPIVGTIYRAVTGDQVAVMPSLIGGALFGGPIGFALSVADNVFKNQTGRNVGETVIAGLFGPSTPADATAEPQLAAATPADPPPRLVIDIPAPRPGERTPPPFADGKPPVIIDLPQPKWALDAGGARPQPSAQQLAQQAARPQIDPAPPAVPTIPVAKAGMPLSFAGPQNSMAASQPAPSPMAQVAAATQAASAQAAVAKSIASAPQNALAGRFRSTDLPQPETDGGLKTHSGSDLVPAANGTPITRDGVPNAMQSALDKYALMMRARNAQNTPTQVSVLR